MGLGMLSGFASGARLASPLILSLVVVAVARGADEVAIEPAVLMERGDYAAAEAALRAQIADEDAPVTDQAARNLEILRRTRMEFPLDAAAVLKELQAELPDATAADVERWTESDALVHRTIDGEVRYFRRAVRNLFLLDSAARQRRDAARQAAGADPAETPPFDLRNHVRELVRLAEDAAEVEILPIRHRVNYALTVHADHPRAEPGAVVRAWLPFPQEYRQQSDVRLIRSSPGEPVIAAASAPQRTAHFEQTIHDASAPLRFEIELEFVTRAYCPKLDAELAEQYDLHGDVYREFTAERLPHIALTPEVRAMAAEIVGDETNPLEKARLVFRWVSHNIPWCSEMEYSIIPNLWGKGLGKRCGDCGVQGMSFIALCRAAGVPARWQSGWQTKPGKSNMHDWAEFYVEPWGWLPADASYGVMDDPDPRVRDFFCGHMDPYRFIVNLDYGRELEPPKTSFRSEPNDFQRGEVEIDGHNLYFDEWDYEFEVESTPLE